MTEPYLKRKPGDFIIADDWNGMQLSVRQHIEQHTHSGNGTGPKITGDGIDPASSVTVQDLKVTGTLEVLGDMIARDVEHHEGDVSLGNEDQDAVTVHGVVRSAHSSGALEIEGPVHIKGDLRVEGKQVLAEVGDLLAKVNDLEATKLNRAGDTITGSLTVQDGLQVDGAMYVSKAAVIGRYIQTAKGAFHDGSLIVHGPIFRQVQIATGLGPVDETNNGQIVSRVLNFTKWFPDTAVRILYCDNIRVYGNGIGSRWEVRINGSPPPGGGIYQDLYHRFNDTFGNLHMPTTILGYASGIGVGNHQVQIWVGPAPGYPINDAYTGWHNSRWTIEAQEVWI